MSQLIHWYVRNMPQLKIWSVSIKMSILRFCMGFRSQGPPSGIQPDQKPKENIVLSSESDIYWQIYLILRRPSWVVSGNCHFEQKATWHADAQLELTDFTLKKTSRLKIEKLDGWPSIRRLHEAAWQYRGRPLRTIPRLPPRCAGWCQMLRSRRPSCLQSEQI